MKQGLKILALMFIITLGSCGARKSQVQKSRYEMEKEEAGQFRTETNEEIQETIITEIDTNLTVPEKQVAIARVFAEVISGHPMVYEDDSFKSETSFDRITGIITNKTTRKELKIPVKQRQTAQRSIKRESADQDDIYMRETAQKEVKEKASERKEGIAWWWLLFAIILYMVWLLFKKNNPLI